MNIQIQSRSMSDPPLYENNFKIKMACVLTTLKNIDVYYDMTLLGRQGLVLLNPGDGK